MAPLANHTNLASVPVAARPVLAPGSNFEVKASESASCHSPPGAHPDTEATRICFVVLNTKETNVASCLAARLDDVNRVFDVKASELDSLLTDALIPLRY